MRVIGAAHPGGPEVLAQHHVEDPHAGRGEVRIRVHAASVNPADLSVRAGEGRGAAIIADRRPPHIPGMDAAGVIDEVGPGVTGYSVGDVVMAIVLPSRRAGGAYAEFIVVPTTSISRAPSGPSLARAATIPMNGLTALRALDLLSLLPGQHLLVTGAEGALGGYVLQLARERGVHVLATAGRESWDRLRSYGASELIDRDDIEDAVRRRAPGGAVDAAVDAAVLKERIVPLVRDGGAVASVRHWKHKAERGIRLLTVRVSDYADRDDLLADLRDRVENGTFVPCDVEVLPAQEAPAAHRRMEAGGIRGRLVLSF